MRPQRFSPHLGAALVALALAIGAVHPVAGAEPVESPSLGATVGPVPDFYPESDGPLLITNRSTTAVVVSIVAGEGWDFGPSFLLAVGERAEVPPVSVGTERSLALITLTAPQTTGQQQGHLAFSTEVRGGVRPDPIPPFLPWLFLALAALVAVWLVGGMFLRFFGPLRRQRRVARIKRRIGAT